MNEDTGHGRIPGAWPVTLTEDHTPNGVGDTQSRSADSSPLTERHGGEQRRQEGSAEQVDAFDPGYEPNPPPIRLPSLPTQPGRLRIQPRHPPRNLPPRNPAPRTRPERQSSFTSALYHYFPIVAPDKSHTHTGFTPSQIRLTSLYLSKRVPMDLIPWILDVAEYWTTCTRECKREAIIQAAAAPPRHTGGSQRWKTGQEDEIGEDEKEGLRDDFGKTWYLATEKIGCAEALDRHRRIEAGDNALGVPERDERVDEHGKDIGENKVPQAGDEARLASEEVQGQKKKSKDVWIRHMVVKTWSHDQGWSQSGHQYYGTYEASYTWFELSILRDGREVEGSKFDFQHNVHAGQYYKEHVHTFGADHEFVQKLQEGDRIVLWARALYPGWVNFVREASIAVTTAPFASAFSSN